MASDGSGRSENVSPNDFRGNTEEFMETRGCNTRVSELQMNLTMLSQVRNQQDLSINSSSSSGSLSQLVDARVKNQVEDNQNVGCSSIYDPPPPYPGRNSDFERDQVIPLRAGDYQQYQQNSGQKVSFSTISSSSYSGLSNDERDKLALYSTSSAEFMGKAPSISTSMSSDPTPSSFSASDASLSAFLARDPDILSLNGLALSPGESIVTTVMDEDEHIDFVYKRASGNRASYATTAATNEGSNHSQVNYSDMTLQEVQATERLIHEANARGNSRMNGRPPLHQPQYQPDFEHSPVELANKKVYHLLQGGLSPSHSQKSSYSPGSAYSDLIQLNPTTRTSEATSKTEFVVFDENHRVEPPSRTESTNDMIPLKF